MEKQSTLIQEILVTRQPIFDKQKNVFAYDLLFKSKQDFQDRVRAAYSSASGDDGDSSSAGVGMDSLFITGLRKLTGGKRAIINFNRHMLLNQLHLMFPSDLLGVELREMGMNRGKDIGRESTIRTDITKTVEKLKSAGYLLIMNALLFNEVDISLAKMADIVGVDFRSMGLQKRFSFSGDPYLRPRFLARSVETATDFEIASDKGYHYFQGEFFSKPDLISVRSIPSYKINLMRILKEINKPTVHFNEIEKILKRDVSLTYKLLRFVNSAAFGLKNTVQSIRHALILLGEVEVRKWLSLIVLSGMGIDKPHELIRSAIIRAKFCESLAAAIHYEKEMSSFFLVGMFSMVDAFLDRPMEEILEELPLQSDIKSALQGKPNRYRDVLELVLDYERGEWRTVCEMVDRLKLDEQEVSTLYLEAIEWGKLL
ncbi:MAG: HDOD domain-containing protein [Candidatus Aminicenantes bacterium]|nr:HDOD domain-containing protein [Candidatus Aminicenantes bacterium]NIM79811.1 HDOD domain-containing protein [Candidatus Aminicenantes bacterium]NIN19141.1 HDOD domain-containing protein [Candidatus Aminicenantes bacterium]NIN43045.1 HDOD domain-containing protein [Candidatus Aminicenantes bacterium]NIN85786.1 HDOD domain-containing protein [Candidatus Aminicenantes bacterium]